MMASPENGEEESWTLRKAIRWTLDYGNHVIETGRVSFIGASLRIIHNQRC